MIYYLGYAHEGLCQKALALAQCFGFEINCQTYPRLELQDCGLFYYTSAKEKLGMDWNDLKWIKRSHGALGKDPLIRACLAKKNSPLILDLTAGWGKDAMLLARAGARVILLEKHPVMAALLEDAHSRLEDHALKDRMRIHWIDAHDYLHQLSQQDFPDVIYLDPMHPSRQKQALVKKHLQALQTLAEPNKDVAGLILLARHKCKERLVLKWPAKGEKFPDCKGSMIGKTIRFDFF
jgi:16S rRNA (guanine1516-N2)-methyltransferase